MYSELWITFNEQMDMIWQDLYAKNVCLMLLTDFKNDLFQSFCYAQDEHLAPIFGAEDNVIPADIDDIVVAAQVTHANSIA